MILQSLQVRNILTFFKIVNLIMTFSSVECHEEETTTLLSFTEEENKQVKSGKSFSNWYLSMGGEILHTARMQKR